MNGHQSRAGGRDNQGRSVNSKRDRTVIQTGSTTINARTRQPPASKEHMGLWQKSVGAWRPGAGIEGHFLNAHSPVLSASTPVHPKACGSHQNRFRVMLRPPGWGGSGTCLQRGLQSSTLRPPRRPTPGSQAARARSATEKQAGQGGQSAGAEGSQREMGWGPGDDEGTGAAQEGAVEGSWYGGAC